MDSSITNIFGTVVKSFELFDIEKYIGINLELKLCEFKSGN